MVVSDFYFGGVIFFPTEDDTPLVVDADGMEAIQVATQGFKAIAGWAAEVFERLCHGWQRVCDRRVPEFRGEVCVKILVKSKA